jgi:hypothetical protein
VFCSEVSASYRQADPPTSCALPGYRATWAKDGYFVLERAGDAQP